MTANAAPVPAAAFGATLRALTLPQRDALLGALPLAEMEAIIYDWYGIWARPSQQVPAGAWRYWINLAGRGYGKTRTILEWARWRETQGARQIALVARTKADARDVLVEGPSGIMSICPHAGLEGRGPIYEPSKRRITWPSGCIARIFSADEPDQLRGPEHDTAVCDELAAWQYEEAWDNMVLGLRAKSAVKPQAAVGTTPKRVKLLRKVLGLPDVVQVNGTTYENAINLDPDFMQSIIRTYEGTRLGLQELHGILLDDNPDALWRQVQIDRARRARPAALRRIVVAVDPEAASTEDSAETGIIVAGRGYDEHFYMLADYTIRGNPAVWGRAVANAARDWQANLVIGEVNNGGDMIGFVIQQADPTLAYREVRATRGKLTRAEPVAMLYEKGWAHHCGLFPALEAQMTQWVPGETSPDRMDALVWAAHELMLQPATWGQGGAVTGAPRPQLTGYRYDS